MVLNMAISPGLILVPSNMIILKERVAGYNNVLTLATSDMKFGVNKDINKVNEKTTETEKTPVSETTVPKTDVSGTTSVKDLPKTNERIYLLGSAVTLGFMVARYVIKMEKFHKLVGI